MGSYRQPTDEYRFWKMTADAEPPEPRLPTVNFGRKRSVISVTEQNHICEEDEDGERVKRHLSRHRHHHPHSRRKASSSSSSSKETCSYTGESTPSSRSGSELIFILLFVKALSFFALASEGIEGPGALFVKVSMDGAPFSRKVDLRNYATYQ